MQTPDLSPGKSGHGVISVTAPPVRVVPFMHPVFLFPRIILLMVLADLIGWIIHIPLLTSAIPRFSTMKPNTALTIGLLAVCCRARGRKTEDQRSHFGWISSSALGIAMALSCGTLGEYATGRSFGLDGFVLGVPMDRFGDPPGRMAFGTALCLTLTGLALGFLDTAPLLSLWTLLTANVITVSVLMSFVLNMGPLTTVPWLRSMSVPTALCLVMLAMATLISRPARKPISFLIPRDSGKGTWLRPTVKVIVFPLLVAVPSVVAMRTGIPEGVVTFLILTVILYSVECWEGYFREASFAGQPESADRPFRP